MESIRKYTATAILAYVAATEYTIGFVLMGVFFGAYWLRDVRETNDEKAKTKVVA
ncbi:MAG: hypothetical protein LRY73_03125 [Bacillus sp. (in: Bacteria)]|nr:hypothetical protein [Bacillus sp. (in: firmicutes)]